MQSRPKGPLGGLSNRWGLALARIQRKCSGICAFGTVRTRRQRGNSQVRHGLAAVVLGTVLLLPQVVFPSEEIHPLEAADTSSPRTTLQTFREACNQVFDLIQSGKARYRSSREAQPLVARIFACLDLSKVPPGVKRYTASETAVLLKEVLDRIEVPPLAEIPGFAEVEAANGELKSWRIPHTEITIHRVEEGPDKDRYLFSPQTVAQIVEFYHRVEHLPYKAGATEGFLDWYLSEPGWMIPPRWIKALPPWTRARFLAVTVWQWVGLVATLVIGLAVMWLAYHIGRQRAETMRKQSVFRFWLTLIFPIAAMLLPPAMEYIIARQLTVRGPVMSVLAVGLDVVFMVAAIVVVFSLGTRLAEGFIASPRVQPKGVDAQLIRLGCRVLSIVAAVALLLEGGQQLGIPLTTLLAGAGVSGLAVALAAQDTLKNFFGSLMIVIDRPFRVGERIVTKGYDGVVEEIGLRSTKIRLLTGHQATIPNDEMARTDVENVGRRLHIRRIQDIALSFDTPPEKVHQALDIVRAALEDHEGMNEDFPPRVFFTDFRRDCLNLRIIYWYHPPAYWNFLAHSEKLNTQIMREFAAAGIRFALPATTTRLARDDGESRPGGFTSEVSIEDPPRA